jgi:hypothetical protein
MLVLFKYGYLRNILRPFGIFCFRLVYFSRIGMLYQEKSGNPFSDNRLSENYELNVLQN